MDRALFVRLFLSNQDPQGWGLSRSEEALIRCQQDTRPIWTDPDGRVGAISGARRKESGDRLLRGIRGATWHSSGGDDVMNICGN